ncbi:hypothetical protein [Kingella oralis]|nr:hypothetical protein [Kingella oralis]
MVGILWLVSGCLGCRCGWGSLKKQRIVPCLADKGECTAWF